MLAIFKRLFNASYMSTAVARLAIGGFNVKFWLILNFLRVLA